MSAETIPFRPRSDRGRMESGRLVRVYEGPPSVPIRDDIGKPPLPEFARLWTGSKYHPIPDGLTEITLAWKRGDQKTCHLCSRCKAHGVKGKFWVNCERIVTREPGDDTLNNTNAAASDKHHIRAALERIRDANL